MNLSVDMTESQHTLLLELIEKYIPNTEIWVYGSRINGTSSPSSDLDMVAFATADQEFTLSDLRDALEESDLPFRVDLFIWNDLPATFHHNIKANHVVLQKATNDNPSSVPD